VEIGYARTSREDQNLDLQLNALRKAGIEDKYIHQEKVSALAAKRPQYDLALKRCRKGDTLVVWKLDRLGRSVLHLIHTINDLKDRGVGFKSLTEGFDTTTPMGTLIFHIMAALAQMERDTTAERTAAGIQAAKERETYTTRGLTFTKEQWDTACAAYKASLNDDKPLTLKQLEAISGMAYARIYNYRDDIRANVPFETRFPFEKNRGSK